MNKPYPPIYYADYLGLEHLLNSQHPKSLEYGAEAHDEMLFIIVHQAYELWFRQILHELDSIIVLFNAPMVDEAAMGTAVARLGRIIEIQKLLIDQIRILETMTPLDFLDFRDYLVPASGFQSVQFRELEIKMGLRPEQRITYNKSGYLSRMQPKDRERLERAEAAPSLFTLLERWLERTPFLDFEGFQFWQAYQKAVEAMLAGDQQVIEQNPTLVDDAKAAQLKELQATRDAFAPLFDESAHAALVTEGKKRLSFKATHAALLIELYRDQPILHLPYKLLQSLVDIDELFTTWRYRHALMVYRMIGLKIGTGGSSGYGYLKATAERYRVYADLANLSTFLIPRSALPKLPEHVSAMLGFAWQG